MMDTNGTRFHLLLGRDDWARCARVPDGRRLEAEFLLEENADLSWDPRRKELTLGKRVFFFSPSAGERPVEPKERRGDPRQLRRYANDIALLVITRRRMHPQAGTLHGES